MFLPGIYLQISKIAYKLIIVEIYWYAKIYYLWIKNLNLSKNNGLKVLRGVPKVFLENSQNAQEKTCARVSFLMKLQAEAKASS